MHGWSSNEPSILNVIDGDNAGINAVNLLKMNGDERVLGLHWLSNSDKYSFKFSKMKINLGIRLDYEKPNKREFSSVVMKMYDPHDRFDIMFYNSWSNLDARNYLKLHKLGLQNS